MILDSGICRIIARENAGEPGNMPRLCDAGVRFEGYYGELGFETSPAYPTQRRMEQRTDARVRILQCREIREDDVAVLTPFGAGTAGRYTITRAYHGTDEENGQAITDLTLREGNA